VAVASWSRRQLPATRTEPETTFVVGVQRWPARPAGAALTVERQSFSVLVRTTKGTWAKEVRARRLAAGRGDRSRAITRRWRPQIRFAEFVDFHQRVRAS
jgi:hypothetical protein